MQTVKVNVFPNEINYIGKLGLGFIQYGTANKNKKIIWEGKTTTKVHVIPTTKGNYNIIEIDNTKAFHISYGVSGIYNIQGNANRKVRFFKCKDHPVAIVDAVTVNSKTKAKNSKNELPQFEFVNGVWKIKDGAKSIGKVIKVDLGIDHSDFVNTEEKKDAIVKSGEYDKLIKILADFAEKLDKDFNLMSVCDVNPRKYAEDYVKRELQGNKIDLDKETSEFKEFLENSTKHHSQISQEVSNVSNNKQLGNKDIKDKCKSSDNVEDKSKLTLESINLYRTKSRCFIFETLESFVDLLNNTELKTREDLIIRYIIDFQKAVENEGKSFSPRQNIINEKIVKDLNDVLAKHNYNFDRNCFFFKQPDNYLLLIDVKTVLNNHFLKPKNLISSDDKLAIICKDIVNHKQFVSDVGLNKRYVNCALNILYQYNVNKYTEKSIVQALFRCMLKYGLSNPQLNYNRELFDLDKQFIIQNYIKPVEKPILQKPTFDYVEKIDIENPIIDVIVNLIKDLRKDRMGSSLTNYIVNYEELIKDFQAENIQVCVMIKYVLAKNGWSRGFQTEPNRLQLLQDILDACGQYIPQKL